jgi:hypothetical protein
MDRKAETKRNLQAKSSMVRDMELRYLNLRLIKDNLKIFHMRLEKVC